MVVHTKVIYHNDTKNNSFFCYILQVIVLYSSSSNDEDDQNGGDMESIHREVDINPEEVNLKENFTQRISKYN